MLRVLPQNVPRSKCGVEVYLSGSPVIVRTSLPYQNMAVLVQHLPAVSNVCSATTTALQRHEDYRRQHREPGTRAQQGGGQLGETQTGLLGGV